MENTAETLRDGIAGRADVIYRRAVQVIYFSAWDGDAVVSKIRLCISKGNTSGTKPGAIGDLSNCNQKEAKKRQSASHDNGFWVGVIDSLYPQGGVILQGKGLLSKSSHGVCPTKPGTLVSGGELSS